MHQNFPIEQKQYIDLLSKMLTRSIKTKRIRSGSMTDTEKNNIVFDKISIGNSNFKKKFDTLTIDEFVVWLYE
jgi:hypothetical protein